MDIPISAMLAVSIVQNASVALQGIGDVLPLTSAVTFSLDLPGVIDRTEGRA